MSCQSKRRFQSQTLRGSLVVVSLFACGCAWAPEEAIDSGGSTGSSATAGSGSEAGMGGTFNAAGTGGALGVAGSFGTSGSTGTAGEFRAGGAGGLGGNGGNGGGAAGSRGGVGGASGSGGGAAGQGSGGQAQAGSGGVGGVTVTFTQLYTQYFNNQQYASNCSGAACHNPGTQKGIDFSTQANGYRSVKASLTKVISQLTSGSMPRGRSKWSSADLALVKAWQAEGAPNN